jgi:mercuric ion binding protein
MKKLSLILLTIVFAFALTGGVYAGDKKSTIKVPTVQCGTCKKNITNALNQIDGIKKIKVDISKKITVVTYDDTKVELGTIEDAITNAGYDANDKKANPEAYEKLDDCCKVR